MEKNANFDDSQFWANVKQVAEDVKKWPQWKREGWAALDKRERPNLHLKKNDYDGAVQYNNNSNRT